MKSQIVTFLFVFISFIAYAQNNEDILTNETIIQLSKIGLQPSVIISKIHSSTCKFDVSTDALIKLGNNSVSADVITEMMKVKSNQKSDETTLKDANNPNAMHAPGIYYYNPNDAEKQLRKVDATVIGSTETHGASYYGYGGGSSISNVSGPASKLQINEEFPTFYFYFENNTDPILSNWWFAVATTPNEFALVKFETNKVSRSFQTARVSGGGGYSGGVSGIPEKVKIPFDYNEVAPGIYSVTFNKPLKYGEYCFVYGTLAPQRYVNNKVFDFGLPKKK